MTEEATYESVEPFLYFLACVLAFERLSCKVINLRWVETVAQEVVEEEVVQLVWADDVFRLLLYLALFVGGSKLW